MRPEILDHSISPSIVPLDPVAHPAQYLSVRGISRSKGRLLGPHVLHTCHRHEPLAPRNRDPAPVHLPVSHPPLPLPERSPSGPASSPACLGPRLNVRPSAGLRANQGIPRARSPYSRDKRPETAGTRGQKRPPIPVPEAPAASVPSTRAPARLPRRTRRASSTTRTAGSGGSPRGSPPIVPGGRVR